MTPLEQAVLEAAIREGVLTRAAVDQALARSAQPGRPPAELLALVAQGLAPAALERLRALHALARGRGEAVGDARTVAASQTRGEAPARAGADEAATRAAGGAAASGRRRPAGPGAGDRVGPYVLEKELGRGGMGVVFIAVHAELGRRVALKLSLSAGAADPRFQREMSALGRLRHPAIVDVHEAGVDAGGRPYLAMALVEGEPLTARLKRDGPLDGATVARIGATLARGLAHAHAAGVLHRDLKPHNVIVDAQGAPHLIDFGLASDAEARERLTRTGESLGTPAYMSPEQASGERDAIGPATDVYGLGALLYHALAGRPPFEGETIVNILAALLRHPPAAPSTVRPGVDPAIEAIVLRCLAKTPAERPASAAALADELEAWLTASTAPPPPRAGRGRALLAGAAIVVIVASGLIGLRRGGAHDAPTIAVAASATGSPPVVSALPAARGYVSTPDVLVVDADTFADVPGLEVREPWLAELRPDGLRLRAGDPARFYESTPGHVRGEAAWPRAGLVAPVQRRLEGAIEVAARLRILVLEPPRRVALVWRALEPASTVVVAGVVPEWKEVEGKRALFMRPAITWTAKPGTGWTEVPLDAGATVRQSAGPIVVELHLRIMDRQATCSWTGSVACVASMTLPGAAGTDAIVGVFPDPLEPLASAPPLALGVANPLREVTSSISDVVLERLEVDAAGVQPVDGPWRPEVGQAGRDLVARKSLSGPLDVLARASGAAPPPPPAGEQPAVMVAGELLATALEDDVAWTGAMALLESEAAPDVVLGKKRLRARPRTVDPDVAPFWGHLSSEWFALSHRQRAAVAELAVDPANPWKIDQPLPEYAGLMVNLAPTNGQLVHAWGIAAAWLEGSPGPLAVKVAALVLAGDLQGALDLAGHDTTLQVRVWAGLAAYRLRRYDDAEHWWSGLDPTRDGPPGTHWLEVLAPAR